MEVGGTDECADAQDATCQTLMTSTVSTLSERIRSAEVLAFDFDGTLVDSNEIKRGAFDICFAEYPEHKAAIRDYCSRFNHTPRWEKFQHVVETILKQPYTDAVAKSLHQRYEAATTQQVIHAPEIPGALAFLNSLPNVPVLLLSSTPIAILSEILAARRMATFFTVVLGAPLDKAARLAEYSQTHTLQPKDVLFFGDSVEDAGAARKAGWPFVAVANPALKAEADYFLTDFRELGEIRR